MNALTKALKDCVGKGSVFILEQTGPATITFSITGGISDITLRLPFAVNGSNPFIYDSQGSTEDKKFHWRSNARTVTLLTSAIEALPEDANPSIIVDNEDWEGGALILSGTWTQKGRGRSKEIVEHNRSFMFDAGML